jgi:hypothetical protein
MWSLGVVMVLGEARASDCGQFDGVIPETLPEWAAYGDSHRLTASGLDPNLSYTLEIRARLGSLSTSWSQPVPVDGQGTLTAELSPPSGAFLHELASDYVTDLSVKLVGRQQDVVHVSLRVPAAFLAWPDGQQAGPVVWDRVTMEQEAPFGITDEALRTSIGATDVDRVLPPLPFASPPQEG